MRDKYHIKHDKKIFLYPQEFKKFYDALSEKQQPYFKIVINTGGRINEILHLTPNDINFERKTLTFRVTKVRSKLGETRPTPRTILISAEFAAWLQRYINRNNIKKNDFLVSLSKAGIDKATKATLKAVDIEKWNDFSSHNFRKTHGNWLKAIGVSGEEICCRLGHDMNTMLKHYVSPSLFNAEDRILILDILGDLYKNERQF
jgi:integrase